MGVPLHPYEHKNERIGRNIREIAGVDPYEQLCPWAFAKKLGYTILTPDRVPGITQSLLNKLLVGGAFSWSGGAVTNIKVIVLNPLHTKERQTATLMEELTHGICGHLPTKIINCGGTHYRDYDYEKENEAYQAGAAALVPKESLSIMVRKGMNAEDIAKHYGVSPDLVKMRIKLCKLWHQYKLYNGVPS